MGPIGAARRSAGTPWRPRCGRCRRHKDRQSSVCDSRKARLISVCLKFTKVALSIRPLDSYAVQATRNENVYWLKASARSAPVMSSPSIRRRIASCRRRTFRNSSNGATAAVFATVSEDGFPYCVPLLYVWMNVKSICTRQPRAGICAAISTGDPARLLRIDEQQGRVSTTAALNAIPVLPIGASACSAASGLSTTGKSSSASAKG